MNIRLIRQSKGYTQEYVANQLGWSHTAYAKVERGETKLTEPKRKAIAKVLGVSTLDLQNGCLGCQSCEVGKLKELLIQQKEMIDKILQAL